MPTSSRRPDSPAAQSSAAGALLGAIVPGAALGAKAPKLDAPPKSFGKGDIGILNYALTLEYLEAAFYNEADKKNNKKAFIKDGATQDFLDAAVRDENAHVETLLEVLGKKAVGTKGIAPDGPLDKAVGAKATLKAVEKTGFITG